MISCRSSTTREHQILPIRTYPKAGGKSALWPHMLSKAKLHSSDHFGTILNEPAGLIAQTVVRHGKSSYDRTYRAHELKRHSIVVPAVVNAWDHDRIDPNEVVNDALTTFHHPYFASRNAPLQQKMAETLEKWWSNQPE